MIDSPSEMISDERLAELYDQNRILRGETP